jgi:hypothetical protein
MWWRGVVGLLLCLVGAIWIAQGSGKLRGSGMTGHSQWAIIGAILFLAGLSCIWWASRVRKSRLTPTQ